MSREKTLAFGFAICGALTNAISAIFVKFASEIPNETMVFCRFAISLLFIIPAAFVGRIQLKPQNIASHFTRAVMGLGGVYCFFYSVKHLALVNSVTLQNTSPLFLPIIIYIGWKTIVPRGEIWAIIAGFVGVILIVQPTTSIREWAAIIGVLGGLFSALGGLGIRELAKKETAETMMAYYFLISTVLSFVPMIYAWKPIADPIQWLYLLLIGLLSLITQFCKTKSLTYVVPTKVSTLSYLSVLFSALFGWWLFHELLPAQEILGVILIITGGLIAILYKHPHKN